MHQYTCTAKSIIRENSISFSSLWPKTTDITNIYSYLDFNSITVFTEMNSITSFLHLPMRYFFKLPFFMSSVTMQKGSSTVHTAYSLIRFLCWSFFMIFISVWISGLMTVEGAKWHMTIKYIRYKTDISQTHPFWMELKMMTYLWWSSVPWNSLIATSIILFHNPCHTSPNSPLPSFFTLVRELRSISHWSLNDRLGRVGLSS